MRYTNSPLDSSTLLKSLKDKGLTVCDKERALTFLNHVSYFRFAAYLRPLRMNGDADLFKPNATFEKAVALYEFDARLRMLLFSAIQKIEISLRSKIINQFSLAHGPFWFSDPELAFDKHKFTENISTLDHELQRSKDDFIKEHIAKYGKEDFPPAWKLLDLTSFGCLTKLFFNFTDESVKKKIARSYGVPQQEILESWMKAINALRNCCAHHGRVWNRIMPVMPQMPHTLQNPWIANRPNVSNRLYSVFCCLVYWANAIDPGNDIVRKFKVLLSDYPMVDTLAMGFPAGWQEEPLLRSHS
jgi:abortive infection bacteriophage resistance protein